MSPPERPGSVRDASTWLGSLPDSLARQRRLLSAIRRWCEDDVGARWLVVGCSLARGNADELSDLDLGIGVAGEDAESAVASAQRRFAAAAGGFGDLVACDSDSLSGVREPHRRVFVQYADRTQVDLVLVAASNSSLQGVVVLYDPAGLVRPDVPGPGATPAEAGTWANRAWEALANVGKYLRRSSVWEAHGQLESARGRAWQLLAAAEQVPEPRHGVTSVLDADPPVRIPTEMGETVAALDVADILRAALQLAAVLTDLEDRLALPRGFGAFVRQDLEAIMPG